MGLNQVIADHTDLVTFPPATHAVYQLIDMPTGLAATFSTPHKLLLWCNACRDKVTVGARLSELLDGLLEPLSEDRVTPQDALDIVTGANRAPMPMAHISNFWLCAAHHSSLCSVLCAE